MSTLLATLHAAADRAHANLYFPRGTGDILAALYVPRHRSPLAPNVRARPAYLPRHSSGRVDAPSLRGVGM